MKRKTHFEAATRDLAESIRRGQVPASQFTPEQLRAIMASKAKVPGFTWHHHQQFGRMQLVPEAVHDAVGHTGGFKLWYPTSGGG